MQVTVHEHVGKSLALLVQGASYESVVDAYWIGLKRPYQGRPCVTGRHEVVRRPDGSVLLRCEPREDMSDDEIVKEIWFQLKYHAKASA